jgi:transcriptional regulator with XRE-family HTH domain
VTVLPKLVRTPDELKAARRALGLSAEGLASMVRMGDGRTVRRWESGDGEIPGAVTVVLETAMDFMRQRDDLSRQLELMQSGEMRVGTMRWGNIPEDNTVDSIARVQDARNSLDQALTILTRRPPGGDRDLSTQVHWYDLKRLTPRYRPGEEDSWSLPGETSVEAALAYFEKAKKFPYRLVICDQDDPAVEFILEQRPVLRTQSGAFQHLRAGNEIVRTFLVKPVARSGYVIEIMQRGVAAPIREQGVESSDLETLTALAHSFYNAEIGQDGIVGVHSVRVRDSNGRVIYRKALGES